MDGPDSGGSRSGGRQPERPKVRSGRLPGARIAPWAAFLLVLLWTRAGSPWLLAPASACVVWAVLAGAAAGRRRALAMALLLGAVVAGMVGEAPSRRIVENGDRDREEAAAAVSAAFDALVADGAGLVERVAAVAAVEAAAGPRVLQDSLEHLLAESGLTAAAVLAADGGLRAWAGSHHGRLPGEIVAGTSSYAYAGTPLFSYLYFAAPLAEGRGTAVAASLMQARLPPPFASGLGDFASRLSERSGERIRIERRDRAGGAGVFDLGWPEETLLSIVIEEADPDARAAEERTLWLRVASALAILAWILLSLNAVRSGVALAAGGLAALGFLLPVETLMAGTALDSLAATRIDAPFPLTIGRLFLASAATAPALLLAAVRMRRSGLAWAAPVAVAVAYPLVHRWLSAGAPLELAGTTDSAWIAYQLTATVLLALLTGATLHLRPRTPRTSAGFLVAGLALAALLSVVVAGAVRVGPGVPAAVLVLWAIPAALIERGASFPSHVSALRWFAACWLAATAMLPLSWSVRTEARMQIAEQQLGELGAAPDPEVNELLERFADHVDSLHQAGAGAVEMMYGSWVASGLSAQGSPIFVTLWSEEGLRQEELRLGAKGELSPVVGEMLPTLAAGGVRAHRLLGEADVRHLIAVPLDDGRVVTGTIPPRRTISEPSGPGPLFASVEAGGDEEFLALARAIGDEAPVGTGAVAWSRNDEGWMGEGWVPYPDGLYSFAYTISIPNLPVMFARATLVLVMDLAAALFLWAPSLWILGLRPPVRVGWRELFASFRARVTWTLFGFFIASNVVFGTLAYRALAGASERTAMALAERVVAQIAEAYREEGGSMEMLARRVGADLLEYRNGELVGGSADELIELGLYESWVDPGIHAALATGSRLGVSRVKQLGDWRYVLAHRRLPDGDIVAAPVPLRAGAAALRRRDVADLLGAAIVLGPILALVLALVVGRALARPIRTLQLASERVGRGNLAVHLPEDRLDEFGAVFSAFNRMVLRLGEARRELLRTTRRTRTIVEEVAAGVIAIDAGGRVTVANPAAELLLGVELQAGASIPRDGPRAPELADWLDVCERSGAAEAALDLRWDDRRIRARARRVVQGEQVGGLVVSLQDVTDELRSERILAWGEMAKQVAHEVKNPLTPMKLSVQHLRRAWSDRHPRFGRVLERNVAAILNEIDRLAAIARSFSRLASPGSQAGEPLVAVEVAPVVREVLDLYGGGDHGPVRLRDRLDEGLPPVRCRADELQQVLLNLLENARAAMPGGGEARIEVARTADGGVGIAVVDEGMGIPPESLPRIFEPRFSTRSGGAGLGLAIVKRLVDSWDAAVAVASEPGEGTRVEIRLQEWVGETGRNE